MTHLNLKTLSIALVVATSSCAYSLGPKPPKDIKIYSHQPTDAYCKEAWCKGKVGFVRTQSKEHKSYSQAADWVAMSPQDITRLLEACPR